MGTFFTGDRRRAVALGYVLYTIGGWLFAFLYFLLFASIGLHTWWLGTLVGVLHGLILLVGALPLLPSVHPRTASEYDGPTALRQLEPPGSLGLNCGVRTPLATLLGQAVYGGTLGDLVQLRDSLA